jgi:predicted hydrocarbon binding protein
MSVSEYAQKMLFSGFMKLKEGRLELSDTRAVIIPAPFIGSFLEESYEENGEKIFDFMFEAGRDLAKETIERIGRKNDMGKREFLSKMVDSANLLGIGKLQVERVNFQSELLEVSLHESPLTEEIEKSEISEDLDHPISLFLKGTVHGMGEEMFGEEVESEYISSEYMGDEKTKVKVQSK